MHAAIITCDAVKKTFAESLTSPTAKRGFALEGAALDRTGTVHGKGGDSTIGHGAVTIAAITSCTNTSNPSVMIGAALLAKNPNPSVDDIKQALARNLCRCGTHTRMIKAVQRAAKDMKAAK